MLRKGTSKFIVLYLLAYVYSSQVDVSRSLEKHPTTIEFHLKKLLDLDIIKPVTVCNGKIVNQTKPKAVECNPVGNEMIYVLTDPYYIYDLFKAHKNSLLNDEISRAVFCYLEYVMLDGVSERVISPKHALGSVLDAFF